MPIELKHEGASLFEKEPDFLVLLATDTSPYKDDTVVVDIIKKSKHLYERHNVYEFMDRKGEKVELYIAEDNTPVIEIRKYSDKRFEIIVDEITTPEAIQEYIKVLNKAFGEDFVYLGRSI